MSLEKETKVKKLVFVLATSMPVTIVRKEMVENAENSKNLRTAAEAGEDGKNPRSNLAQVPSIQYLITFKKKFLSVLFDSNSEVNAIYPTFIKKLGLSIKLTDIEVQEIDSIILDTYQMIVIAFLVTNKMY